MNEARRCPHGVVVGPLDDYDVPDDQPVVSSYCGWCYLRVTGRPVPDDERAAYEFPPVSGGRESETGQ